jgi:hypothetical protein
MVSQGIDNHHQSTGKHLFASVSGLFQKRISDVALTTATTGNVAK